MPGSKSLATQLLAQDVGGVDLGEQLGLEVEARRQVEIGVRRSREAVDAAVFTALIGVDRVVEGQVRRLVLVQQRLRLALG